jgi:hypothetical protein
LATAAKSEPILCKSVSGLLVLSLLSVTPPYNERRLKPRAKAT